MCKCTCTYVCMPAEVSTLYVPQSLSTFFFFFILACQYLLACMYVYVPYTCLEPKRPEGASDLEQELQMIMSHHEGAGKQTLFTTEPSLHTQSFLLRQLTNTAPVCSCLYLASTGIRCTHHSAWILHWVLMYAQLWGCGCVGEEGERREPTSG